MRRVPRSSGFLGALCLAVTVCAVYAIPLHDAAFDQDETDQLEKLEHLAADPSWSERLQLWTFWEGTREELFEISDGVVSGDEAWCADSQHRRAKMVFFRPLSSLSLALDHALFGLDALGYHLHTLLGYGILLLCVAGFYGRAFADPVAVARWTPALALGALALFALDATHVEVLARASTRHLLMAAIFGVLGLWAYLGWRRSGEGRLLGAALACFALGALCSENILQALAYPIAFEWFGREAPRRQRLGACLALAAIGLAYVAAYALAGYGASGGGYIDPIAQPGELARSAALRWSDLALEEMLALASWRGWGASPWRLTGLELPPPARIAGGAALIAAAAWLAAVAARRLPREAGRNVAWLTAGAGLSLVPVLVGQPGTRLLLIPSLGASALFAAAIALAWHTATRAGLGAGVRAAALVALALLAVRGVGSPIALYLQADRFAEISRVVTEHWRPPGDARGFEGAALEDPDFAAVSDVIVLAAPSTSVPGSPFPALRRLAEGDRVLAGSEGKRWWYLSNNVLEYSHALRRIRADEFDLSLRAPRRTERLMNNLWIGCRLPKGETVETDAFRLKVVGVMRVGGIHRIRVRTRLPLDSPELWLATWRDGALRRVEPPPVGDTLDLP